MKIEQPNKSNWANMPDNWWLKLCYLARKSTPFFILWVSVLLMYGVICAQTNEMGRGEFYRFIFFLQHPVVIVINILTLVAALIHSITWFYSTAKVLSTIWSNEKVSAIFVIGFWLVTMIISALLLLLIFGHFK